MPEPFEKWRVKTAITDRLKECMEEEHYHGSLTSFIEGILDRYSNGLLRDVREVQTVHAVRVKRRKGKSDEQAA